MWINGKLALALVLAGLAPAAAPHPAVRSYCLGCHNEKAKSGGVSLNASPAQDPATWEKALRKLRTRQMPPPGMPKPDEAAYGVLTSSIERELDQFAAAKPNPGRTDTFRRLNRTEYRNAIRDLLALDVDVSPLLPADETSHGFDNITVGQLSPALLEKYLSAAQKISRLALGSPARSPGGDTIVIPPDLTQEDTLSGLPFGTRGGALVRYNFPLNGEYEFQLRLTRDRNERVEGLRQSHELELAVDGKRVKTFTVRPASEDEPHHLVDKDLRVRLPVQAGQHEVTATFVKRTAALLETERQPYAARFNADRHPRTQPALYSISIAGPYAASGAGDTESRRRILVCRPATPGQEEGCARQILGSLLRKAYRRPVTPADLTAPMSFYREARVKESFEGGIEMALRALLTSPNFLFRIERDPPGTRPGMAYRLSDIDLASRLSFFLWSSIPDEPLLNAATAGELRKPSGLQRQALRMLRDRRASALVSSFAAQWLYLRNLDAVTPDPRLYPDFDENLRQAMRQETEMLMESVMREDRSVLDLLRADYTFLNERLAKHYAIPHITGNHFRRVQLDKSSVRGGLLSQGSILTVTSYATRTSPVIRGKWVLTNILGAPPSPPPADVPPLKEKGTQGKALSIRQQMAAHRDNPACSSCHTLMDPVGFALENFDAVGRWRTDDGALPVDAQGSFPDGTRFEGAAGLQRAVLNRPELFAGAITEKLLTYALGRGPEPYDAPAVRKVIRTSQAQAYRFSSLIAGIVESTPFQMRRAE